MKKCLIVVDYQVDFVCGSLGFEKAKELDERIAQKIEKYRNENGEVIFTFDTHKEDYLNTQEGKKLPVPHCILGTDGHKLYGKTALTKKENDKCFFKECFGSAELFDYLRENSFDSIELCGVVSNICVISNAVLAKTAQPETKIVVDSSCIASNDNELNEAVINVMKSLQIEVF